MSHPYGWFSLAPPLVAIILAIATRRILPSLLAGIFVGSLILNAGQPLAAIADTCQVHLWQKLVDADMISVFVFTLLMGAMVGIINRSGGMRGMVNLVTPLASNRRRGQVIGWLLGLFVFFDDYANTLLLGNTLRPVFDRLRISREKLAYVVDSTAAPVSGLALVSTWVAVEISYIDSGIVQLPADANLTAFDLFLRSIPYRFYVLFALLFVPLVGLLGREFGPMLASERQALTQPPAAAQQGKDRSAADPADRRWQNAVLPIVATVAAIVWFLYRSGLAALQSPGTSPPSPSPSIMQIFGHADAYMSLVWGSLIGVLVAYSLVGMQRHLSTSELGEAAGEGALSMVPALAILWLAATLSTMTRGEIGAADSPADELTRPNTQATFDPTKYPDHETRLYTADYLSSLLEQRVSPPLLPTIVFVLASCVAFATGTSYGTMGIVMPLVIPLAYTALIGSEATSIGTHPAMLGCVGGVLAGAIFGDHCSPISDTTVLSSQSSGCDHVAHVWTQLPYALAVGVVSIVCGTLPIGFGLSVWIALPMGLAALWICLLVLGRPLEDERPGA